MAMTRSEIWSWMNDVLPFVVMLMVICLDVGVTTTVKAAMNGGMDSIVFVVYHDILGILILLPFFTVHIFRKAARPPLTVHLLLRFFILGLVGLCLLQVLSYVGVDYSSPTMVSAIGNLNPADTFLLAVLFRMEKIDVTSSSSRAKLLGTITAISGAMVFALYKGPEIFRMIPVPDTPNQLLLSEPSNWVIGGLYLVIAGLCSSLWNVLQTATVREYPDQFMIVFFFLLFGTIQCIALSFVLVRDPSAWVLHQGIEMIAVVFGGVYSVVLRYSALTWCLEKKGPVFVTIFSPLSIVIAVIMGVTFLGDSVHLGSAIGAGIISAGFYTVMWGHAKEKNTLLLLIHEELAVADEHGPSNQNTPLLSSENELKC